MEKIFDGISKAVLDTTEKVVQDTGIGKLVENTTGIHVDPNIHDNGLHTEVKGPLAQVITGGNGDKVDAHLKIGDDDHTHLTHIHSGLTVQKGDATVLKGTGNIDQFGVEIGGTIGNVVCSGYYKIEDSNSVASAVSDLVSKGPELIPGYANVTSVLRNELQLDIGGIFSICLDKILEKILKITFSKLIDGILGATKDLFSTYVSVSVGPEVGFRFEAVYGEEMPITLNGQRVVFRKFEVGAQFKQYGGDGGIAFSDPSSKAYDGFERAIFMTGSICVGCNATCSLIICYNPSSEQLKIENSLDQLKQNFTDSLGNLFKL